MVLQTKFAQIKNNNLYIDDVKATDFPGSIAMVGTPQECLQSHVIEDVFQTSWKRFTDEDGEYYFFE